MPTFGPFGLEGGGISRPLLISVGSTSQTPLKPPWVKAKRAKTLSATSLAGPDPTFGPFGLGVRGVWA